jgi:hypothetical protein
MCVKFKKYFSIALLTLYKICTYSTYNTYSTCRTYVPNDSFISDFKNSSKEHEHDCSDVQCEVRSS